MTKKGRSNLPEKHLQDLKRKERLRVLSKADQGKALLQTRSLLRPAYEESKEGLGKEAMVWNQTAKNKYRGIGRLNPGRAKSLICREMRELCHIRHGLGDRDGAPYFRVKVEPGLTWQEQFVLAFMLIIQACWLWDIRAMRAWTANGIAVSCKWYV